MQIADYIDADLLDKFEFHNYNHAIEIITQAFPEEWREVVECLRKLDITTDDLREAGGNETIALLTKAVTPLQQVYNRHRR